ncbi:hypothetical protein H5410_022005 [Solanum commersonii]|uniref:Uncharacterized protein n=1 Tax=Solanum commersonii TaxID=4109 RepID=A0A9J5ZGU9_SOLCO|nr:hypothetical protein H5410_022005 [Solanum commersonii]
MRHSNVIICTFISMQVDIPKQMFYKIIRRTPNLKELQILQSIDPNMIFSRDIFHKRYLYTMGSHGFAG